MHKSYSRILGAASQEAWAIHKQKGKAIAEFFSSIAIGETREMRADKFTPAKDKKIATQNGNIMVLPLQGVIMNRAAAFDDISGPGGTSAEMFSRLFAEAVGNDNIKAIILDVDSPGGTVSGVPELSKMIFEARGKKTIVAQVDAGCFSAAYWIASAAQEIVMTPSSEIGSVGVYTLHEDMSKQLEMVGLKETFISAGKYKTEGNPFEPLSDVAAAAIQARVDDYYSMFIADLARNRGMTKAAVLQEFGEGRVVGAKDAVALGMADRIGTMQETLARFGVSLYSSGQRSKASPVERMERTAKSLKAKGG